MFQTKFDRWLIENFIYEHHILVMQLPEDLDGSIDVSEIQSTQYKYLLKVRNKKLSEKLIDDMRESGAIFSTKIVEGNYWYNPVIFNKKKSFTFRVFWWCVFIVVLIIGTIKIRQFMDTEFYQELKESIIEVIG